MGRFDVIDELYNREGIGDRVGFGTKPAIVVIDLQQSLTDSNRPGGTELGDVVEKTNAVLSAAHERDVPVVFTVLGHSHPEADDAGVYAEKVPAIQNLKLGTDSTSIDNRLDRESTDHIIEKRQSSAFHGTELRSMLTSREVDTVILTGFSTSGCVRATAVDGIANGYRVIVPEECVSDRARAVHEANLFDIDAKCGDVRPVDEVIEYMTGELGKQD